MWFYAVRCGRTPGVYNTWLACFQKRKECEEQVKKFPQASFKKFSSKSAALTFVSSPVPSVSTLSSASSVSSDSPAPSSSEGNAEVFSTKRGLDIVQLKPTNKKTKATTTFSASFSSSSSSSSPSQTTSSTSKREKEEKEERERVVVYTDGSCQGNGTKQAKAGLGVFFAHEDKRNLSERVGGKQTNQRAELLAAIRALEQIHDLSVEVEIRTDSQYVIKGMTDWIFSWKQNDWSKPVENKELFLRLDNLCLQRHFPVVWTYVAGHTGEEGNEAADQLANNGCLKDLPPSPSLSNEPK
eukprot:TRINITY_DN6269_c0_g2_i1.p1 TRINITY_DN6269_c0_g2~~TRINITY_DN6269_c0_g2_i1.p1  ORF type:complete len:298 (+),score=94.13 TRINITY_DN6269_c0_g2_i1:113-1006(+)